MIIFAVFELLGGIGIFLSGLKNIANDFSNAINEKLSKRLLKVTDCKFFAFLLGVLTTAFTQSSSAVNMLAVSLVEAGTLTLTGACAVIIGTNIGTTVTAQIVSATFGGGINLSAIGALIVFLGFLLSESKTDKIKLIGKTLFSFGLVFTGIKIITTAMANFYDKDWFVNLFLPKSGAISLLNGFFITALCQSSSVVSGVLVILAGNNVLNVETGIYMMLGANVGSSIAVIFASDKLSLSAKRASYFNLLFNFFGALIFYIIMTFFSKEICFMLLEFSPTPATAVANFHTLFNVVFGIIALPFLEKLSKLLCKILPEKPSFVKNRA